MKKYTLTGFVTVTATATVEAKSLAEALEKSKKFKKRLDNGCRFPDDEVWIVSEVDGEVVDITMSQRTGSPYLQVG